MALSHVVWCGSCSWGAQLLAYCVAERWPCYKSNASAEVSPRGRGRKGHRSATFVAHGHAQVPSWGLHQLEGFGPEIFNSESSGCWRLNRRPRQAASSCSSRNSVLCLRTGSVLAQVSLKKHTARWGSACQQLLRVHVTRRCGLDSILQCCTGPERRRCLMICASSRAALRS